MLRLVEPLLLLVLNFNDIINDVIVLQATALKDTTSSKPPFRMKLSVTLHAPHIIIPYTSSTSTGSLHVDLGKFTLSNRFIHVYDLLDTKATSVSLEASQIILDTMEITSSSICVYRENASSGVVQGVAIRNKILDSLNFTAIVRRNLSPGKHPLMFPDVKIQLNIENEIQVLPSHHVTSHVIVSCCSFICQMKTYKCF